MRAPGQPNWLGRPTLIAQIHPSSGRRLTLPSNSWKTKLLTRRPLSAAAEARCLSLTLSRLSLSPPAGAALRVFSQTLSTVRTVHPTALARSAMTVSGAAAGCTPLALLHTTHA